VIIGTPQVNTGGGPKNLLLASDVNFDLQANDPFGPGSSAAALDLASTGLDNLVIAARKGITWDSSFNVTGTSQNLTLYTHEAATAMTGTGVPKPSSMGDIKMVGKTSPPLVQLDTGAFEAHAARDMIVTTQGVSTTPTVIQAQDVNLSAGRDLRVGSNLTITASGTLNLTAQGSITVVDSTQLVRLSRLDHLSLSMMAVTGDVNLQGTAGRPVSVSAYFAQIEAGGNVTIDRTSIGADFVRVRTLAPNGTLTIGNSSISATQSMDLYADGSNGTVRFVGNTTLNSGTNGTTTVAGHTVQVDSGVSVTVTAPAGFNVHSDVENFNTGSYGNFISNGSPLNFVADGIRGPHKHNFASRPGF
jgi:hypothetical protein